MATARAVGAEGTAAVVRQLLGARRRDLAALVAWTPLQALPTLVGGAAVARAVDDGFLRGRVAVGLAWLGAVAAAALVGGAATHAAYLRLGAVVEPVRDDLVRRAVGGALRRAARTGATPDADAVAGVTEHAEAARDTLAGLVMTTVGFPTAALAALVGIATLAPVVLWLVVPPLVAALAVLLATARPLARRQRAVLLANEALARQVGRYAAGLRDVTACGAEDRSLARLGRDVDAHRAAAERIAGLTALRVGALGAGGWLPVVLLLLATPWLTRRGMTPGEVVGAFAYLTQGLHQALATLVGGLTGSGTRTVAILQRAVETSEAPLPVPAAPSRRAAPVAARLRGVTFAYGPHSEPVLRGLDLDVGVDDHLAVVGPSGIGKSTLAALVAGTVRPQAGEVLVAGHPAHAARADARVLIPQEAYVFAGTVGENLRYLRPDATPAMTDRSVRALGLRPLVDALGGYDAPVTRAQLTAAEQQLVALARAHLSPARLVLLDEATCHLDPTTEAEAEEAFVARGGALVVIAHRMSSALRARRVLVLDGVTARVGTHEELLDASLLYRDLVGYWQATGRA
jgi:ATP-binding cassette subfamily C protein